MSPEPPSGEDVLATYAGTQPSLGDLAGFNFSRNAWALQEKWKGRPAGFGGSDDMGWGFNLEDDQYNPIVQGPDGLSSGRLHLDATEANDTIADAELKTRPFFRREVSGGLESVLFTDNHVVLSTIQPHLNRLLAYALPALSNPTGGWEGGDLGNGEFFDKDSAINMNSEIEDWPRDNELWWHSDIKNVAFQFVCNIFNKIVIRGELQ